MTWQKIVGLKTNKTTHEGEIKDGKRVMEKVGITTKRKPEFENEDIIIVEVESKKGNEYDVELDTPLNRTANKGDEAIQKFKEGEEVWIDVEFGEKPTASPHPETLKIGEW